MEKTFRFNMEDIKTVIVISIMKIFYLINNKLEEGYYI